MKCLRCGHCCKHYSVVIVDDPALGIQEENLKFHRGTGEPCQHLRGDAPGEYSCAIHDEPWYEETPCFSHGQIEESLEEPCRMGVYVIKRFKGGL